MGINAAPHHFRHSLWPRTLGFRGLEHPAPPRKRGRPCPPVTAAPSRTHSELQQAQSVCSREPGGFPQGGEMPGARLASEAGGGGGNCLPRAWPHPCQPGGTSQELVVAFSSHSPLPQHFAASSVDRWTLVCLWSGIVAGRLGRFGCWTCPPHTTGRARATAQGGPPQRGHLLLPAGGCRARGG